MNWKENWDEAVGLWSAKGPGHTVLSKHLDILHPGPNAAARLLAAAQTDALAEIQVEKVLAALREMQWKKPDDMQGCMSWYREEDRPCDTNAAFFTGLSLIVLRIQYCQLLNQSSRTLLDEILSGLDVWFHHAVAEGSFYYPNKYLGDLVCKWLLQEIMDKTEENGLVATRMRQAADYWLKQHWGWGEHLSDGYAWVCLNELSVLLLLSQKLPEDLRRSYQQLTSELLSIEDGFDGGPRVPALRSYAFEQAKMHLNYRDSISPLKEPMANFGNMPVLGPLLDERGWHAAMPRRQPRRQDLTVPCFAGTLATAHIENDIRLGSMSRFPIMPSAEHPTWGLAWQCFPVALSRGESDWGFLQWETIEKGTRRAHPANGGPTAHIPKALSETISPPVFGQTYALQRGAGVLILRVMRSIPNTWESVTDRFRLVSATATAEQTCSESWSQLLLHYPKREVSIHFVPLQNGAGKPGLASSDVSSIDWDLIWTADPSPSHEQRILVNLWAISLDGKISTAPQISELSEHQEPRSEEEKKRKLDWQWQNTRWQVIIDPLSDTPLREA